MRNRSLLTIFALLLLAAPALAQSNPSMQRASVKAWIYTDSSKTSATEIGVSSFQKFAQTMSDAIKQKHVTILVEPTGPVGLGAPFQYKSELINLFQPGRPLNVPEKTFDLTMTPRALSSSEVTLQVKYNAVLPFTINLRPGEVYVVEVTVPGQRDRMFLAIAANETP